MAVFLPFGAKKKPLRNIKKQSKNESQYLDYQSLRCFVYRPAGGISFTRKIASYGLYTLSGVKPIDLCHLLAR